MLAVGHITVLATNLLTVVKLMILNCIACMYVVYLCLPFVARDPAIWIQLAVYP